MEASGVKKSNRKSNRTSIWKRDKKERVSSQ
jgi:hypothetical protein